MTSTAPPDPDGTRPTGAGVGAAGPRTTKLAIVGAGAVGSTLAYAALMRGAARTVAMLDVNRAKVEAEVLDLQHGIEFVPMARVEGSDDVAVCAGADVVVVTAGAKQKPGQTRLDLAGTTIGLMRSILPGLVEVAPDAVYVMVTNPVDIVTYAALKISGLPPRRLFGSGTVLDSSRLRFLVAQQCGVAVQNVHAYVAGEHGDSEIPLWSSATVGGVPLLEWSGLAGRPALTEDVRDEIAREVVQSAYRIIEGKGATNYAVGLAGTRIIEAVLGDEHRILPVSTLVDGDHGIEDVCLSLPTLVDRRGAVERVQVPLAADELAGLHASAESLRTAARRFGL
jgi:L-lactate dehydrogenase